MKRASFLILLSLIVSACQKANNSVVDVSQTVNVIHLDLFGPDSVDIASALSQHPPMLTIADSFQVSVDPWQNLSYLEVQVQNDSGAVLFERTLQPFEGAYISGTLSFTTASVYVEDLTYTFTAYNDAGMPGNYISKMVHLFNSATEAPVVDSVIAPDSIKSGNVTDTLYAVVSDPNGLSDIQQVYFNVTLPNGSPATGNPHEMYDDGGASGAPGDVDKKAGDGIYTLGITLSPSNPLGTYGFTFYAVNRSGITSAPVSHKITVY